MLYQRTYSIQEDMLWLKSLLLPSSLLLLMSFLLLVVATFWLLLSTLLLLAFLEWLTSHWFLHPCCWRPLMFELSLVSVEPSVDVLLLLLFHSWNPCYVKLESLLLMPILLLRSLLLQIFPTFLVVPAFVGAPTVAVFPAVVSVEGRVYFGVIQTVNS